MTMSVKLAPSRSVDFLKASRLKLTCFSLFSYFRHGGNFKISLNFMEGHAFEQKVYIVR